MSEMVDCLFGSSHKFHRSCLKCHIHYVTTLVLISLRSSVCILHTQTTLSYSLCLEWLSILQCYLNLAVILNHLWYTLKILIFHLHLWRFEFIKSEVRPRHQLYVWCWRTIKFRKHNLNFFYLTFQIHFNTSSKSIF